MVSEMDEGIIRLANALDTEDMIGFTRAFVEDFKTGRNCVNRELLPWIEDIDKGWTGVLCLGMGGSAAGGDFLATLCDHKGAVPVRCHRGYDIPSWWTPDWLSYFLTFTSSPVTSGSSSSISLGNPGASSFSPHRSSSLLTIFGDHSRSP